MALNCVPNPYAGPVAYAALPDDLDIDRYAPLSFWIAKSRGRIYPTAELAQAVGVEGEQLVCLPSDVFFTATTEWYKWAWGLMAELAKLQQHQKGVQLLNLYPPPEPLTSTQLLMDFGALHMRFWFNGLFHVAVCNRIETNWARLPLLPLEAHDWADMIEKTYKTPPLVRACWRFLWHTAAELLEWYLTHGPQRWGRTISETDAEAECLAEVISAWSLCCFHSPADCRPDASKSVRSRQLAQLEQYVVFDLADHMRHLNNGHRRPLAPPPPLAIILRMPQPEKLPPNWVWQRLVRAKMSKHFGLQDIVYYPSMSDVKSGKNRKRSYKEISAALQNPFINPSCLDGDAGQ